MGEAKTSIVRVIADQPGTSLPDWIEGNRDFLIESLRRTGVVLLRDFAVHDLAAFKQVRAVLLTETTSYVEGATPRSELGEEVFTSTEFPATETIALHNENSYAATWPGLLVLCCLRPPKVGGATPVADVRAVLQRLPLDLLDRFYDRGWMLLRNYRPDFGLPWPKAFGTDDRQEVEDYCRDAQIDFEWLGNEVLRTSQGRDAFARHPASGEVVWFNHVAFWHPSRLQDEVRQLLLEEFGEDGLPFDTRYGDGSSIAAEDISAIHASYESEKIRFDWAEGDVFVLDNMLVAHGREPYEGDRLIVVSMGQGCNRKDCVVQESTFKNRDWLR